MGDRKMRRSIADWLYHRRWWPWLLTLVFAPGILAPASWWFDVRSIYISDAKVGEHVVIALDREIKLPFDGEWTVAIRRWENGWKPYCTAPGTQFYQPDNTLPDPLTMQWWTANQCHPLSVGRYETVTVWKICPPLFLVPCKRAEIRSNVFEVRS